MLVAYLKRNYDEIDNGISRIHYMHVIHMRLQICLGGIDDGCQYGKHGKILLL
jgi:hypothetical protein